MGKVEEVLGKMLAQGIEIWWPEEGDRREGATVERADELRSSLVDVRRRKEEMTSGSPQRGKISRCYTDHINTDRIMQLAS